MIITPQQQRFHRAAFDIQTNEPFSRDSIYLARQLVQVTLPHRDPGNTPHWSRTNGNLTLTIRPGWDAKTRQPLPYPCGTVPRLLLFWLTTEALRTSSRKLRLGGTLAQFMREVGLNPACGGKRGDHSRLKSQMLRLFRATISFEETIRDGKKEGDRWLDMQVAPRGELWWDARDIEQESLFDSWIELGETFYESIMAAPVPVDVRALHALKNSPLALDLYAWACYRSFLVTKRREKAFVPWRSLEKQLGTDYADPKDFKKKAKAMLRKVKLVYPGLELEEVNGGIVLYPSRPAIPSLR